MAVPTEECDLLMKGGVTSGVVYPRLAARLAQDYAFRNIGGTSAGAIAAAATAAAELGRRSGSNPDGFEQLKSLPAWLGRAQRGRSRLLQLFQAGPELAQAFGMALALLSWRGGANAVSLAAMTFARPLQAGLAVLLCVGGAHLLANVPPQMALQLALLSAVIASAVTALANHMGRQYGDGASAQCLQKRGLAPSNILGAILFTVTLATVFAQWALDSSLIGIARTVIAQYFGIAAGFAWSLYRQGGALLRALQRNHFGLCSGLTEDKRPRAAQALTDWLEGYLAQLAGMPAGELLTFGHLWSSSTRGITATTPIQQARAQRDIHLEMVTTALSQHTPYAVPFRSNAGTFYFAPSEWAKLFPQNVMQWLADCAPLSEHTHPDTGERLQPLVRDGRLPVIIGVRMSLSFPILLSAVPMFAIDYSEQPAPVVKRVWFSDGGISSNLPLQAFDTLLPVRPVFTINLKEEHPAYKIEGSTNRVYLPTSNKQGFTRYWSTFSEQQDFAVVDFLKSIIDTMQSWRDEMLFPYPAYRDRILQVSLRDDEGGLNLSMSPEQIRMLADAGNSAGQMVYTRFHPKAGGVGWQNHQQLALINLLGNFEDLALNAATAPGRGNWAAILDQSRLKGQRLRNAKELLEDLQEIGKRVSSNDSRVSTKMGRPRPYLRMSPEM